MIRAIGFACGLGLSVVAFAPARAAVKICNDEKLPIHVALASQGDAGFSTAGWWSPAPGACVDADFAVLGDTLYYSADSDSFLNGNQRTHEHWGNKVQLYVKKKDFKLTKADQAQSGATSAMFGSAELVQAPPGKTVSNTIHFKAGGSSIESTVSK